VAETSTDMSGIQKIHNQLVYNIETFINGTKYIIDEIIIRDLSMINDDMIIGLRFLQHSVQTTIIHDKEITFIPYQDNVPYMSEVRKRGVTKQISDLDTRLEETHDIDKRITFIPYQDNVPYISEVRKYDGTKQISNLDSRLEETHDISENDKEVEISTSTETYYISNTNTECI
jgi:hypothetical protein